MVPQRRLKGTCVLRKEGRSQRGKKSSGSLYMSKTEISSIAWRFIGMLRIVRFAVINTNSMRSPLPSVQLVQLKRSSPDRALLSNPPDGESIRTMANPTNLYSIIPPFRSGPLPTFQAFNPRKETFLLRLLIRTWTTCSIMRHSPFQD